MSLSNEQISSLLKMISSTAEDTLDCDGCFGKMAEFADAELAGKEIPDALRSIQIHLQQCTCCK